MLSSFDLRTPPPWDSTTIRQLGKALIAGTPRPAHCPGYDEVMLWHNDLAAEVAATIVMTEWETLSPDDFDMAARPKTIDTLLQKLRRPKPRLHLDQVQDLAGVRIDADMTLTQQTRLADEIAEHFGGEGTQVRDLRKTPHSGYRAVHVWLRLPAGRVEVQIRTLGQSAWANVYETLGDKFGRGIRYDEPHEDAAVQSIVESLHHASEQLAAYEKLRDELARLLPSVRQQADEEPDPVRAAKILESAGVLEDTVNTAYKSFIEVFQQAKRTIDDMEVES